MSYCIREGIKAYPVFDRRKFKWFIEVNNNGKIQRGTKPIATGKILYSKPLMIMIEKTYKYYVELLNKKYGSTG